MQEVSSALEVVKNLCSHAGDITATTRLVVARWNAGDREAGLTQQLTEAVLHDINNLRIAAEHLDVLDSLLIKDGTSSPIADKLFALSQGSERKTARYRNTPVETSLGLLARQVRDFLFRIGSNVDSVIGEYFIETSFFADPTYWLRIRNQLEVELRRAGCKLHGPLANALDLALVIPSELAADSLSELFDFIESTGSASEQDVPTKKPMTPAEIKGKAYALIANGERYSSCRELANAVGCARRAKAIQEVWRQCGERITNPRAVDLHCNIQDPSDQLNQLIDEQACDDASTGKPQRRRV